MALRIHNTLTRSIEEFVPLDPSSKKVGLYCCGPTVYDFAHIGNWRTFVFADLVRRTLELNGYEVRHVMNITDVEDKIIRRVRETKTTLREFTSPYEAAFLDDLKALGCHAPHLTPRATASGRPGPGRSRNFAPRMRITLTAGSASSTLIWNFTGLSSPLSTLTCCRSFLR